MAKKFKPATIFIAFNKPVSGIALFILEVKMKTLLILIFWMTCHAYATVSSPCEPLLTNTPGAIHTRIYRPFTYMKLGQFRAASGQLQSTYNHRTQYRTIPIAEGITVWSSIKAQSQGFIRGIRQPRLLSVEAEYVAGDLRQSFAAPASVFEQMPSKLDDNAGFSFILKKGLVEKVSIRLRTRNTAKISVNNGEEIFYEADFETPDKKDWVFIPLSRFRMNATSASTLNQARADRLPETIAADDLLLDIGFSSLSPEPIALQVYQGMELDPGYNSDFRDTVRRLNLTPDRMQAINPDLPLYDLDYSADKMKAAVIKFFESMQHPTSQAYATRTIRQGEDAIRSELKPFGWKATAVFNGSVELRTVLADNIRDKNIPKETGGFGVLHGPFSHHMQFLAGFHFLNKREVSLVSLFMTRFVAGKSPEYWFLWQSLFDTRREGTIHGNRYWRDLH